MSALQSATDYRKEARRLRTLAENITTPALRQTVLDAAATYDKLADRQRHGISALSSFARRQRSGERREDHAGEMPQMRGQRIPDASSVRERDRS